jgi:Rieske Fe-S protein
MNTRLEGRRRFIGAALALVAFARSAWAQVTNTGPVRYAALSRPVRIPLETVAVPWTPVAFVAEAMAPRRVLISGVLFRTEKDLSALCVTCPHEQCQVDLVTDQERVARMPGSTSSHPLFECGCHLSVFDAANEGARLSGETPRGLYRFRIGSVSQGIVEITEVEAVALSQV